jgi:hypothetical protein
MREFFLVIFFGFCFGICGYIWYRNNLVYDYLINITCDESLDWEEKKHRLNTLPSQFTMVLCDLFTFNWDYRFEEKK